MTTSAAHASAFCDEARREGKVWTVGDGDGIPSPPSGDGSRSMPFWSLRSRAELVITSVPAYGGFEPVEVSLEAFIARWLPGLREDGLLVGLNWSGSRATGYDVTPAEVLTRLALSDEEVDRLIAEGDALATAGDRRAAALVWRRLIDAGWIAFYLNLGLDLLEVDDADEAREAFRLGAELGLDECRYEFALIREEEGAVDEARSVYIELSADGDREATFALGMSYLNAEERDRAIAILTPLLATDDENGHAAAGALGTIYFERGDTEEAEPLLLRGQVYPPAREALAELARRRG